MRALALDTTTAAGSVALVDNDRCIAERRGDASRPHAERLPRDVTALVDAFAGDGAIRYADVIRMSRFAAARIVEAPPLAGTIGRLAIARAARGETPAPGAIRPLYVRRPDAEIDRDRKLEGSRA